VSQILAKIQTLVRSGELRVSLHGFRELAADDILLSDVLDSIQHAVTIEEYPDFARGPSVLVLQRDGKGRPIHVVWGIPRDSDNPAVLVTAYRPDPGRWSDDLTRRRK
jgi:hypothetical protein